MYIITAFDKSGNGLYVKGARNMKMAKKCAREFQFLPGVSSVKIREQEKRGDDGNGRSKN